MKIAERTAAWRRERRVLLRVSRAAWRLEQAERERSWALASARAEGVSIRTLAAAVRLSSSRVHQIVAAADLDELDAQLGELRAAGWPAPEDPDGDDDAELDGRELIADRLVDEAGWLRQCAGWLTRLHAGESPPPVNLRPGGDHPGRALLVAGLARVAAILDRIAADIDELARARRAGDLERAGGRGARNQSRGPRLSDLSRKSVGVDRVVSGVSCWARLLAGSREIDGAGGVEVDPACGDAAPRPGRAGVRSAFAYRTHPQCFPGDEPVPGKRPGRQVQRRRRQCTLLTLRRPASLRVRFLRPATRRPGRRPGRRRQHRRRLLTITRAGIPHVYGSAVVRLSCSRVTLRLAVASGAPGRHLP